MPALVLIYTGIDVAASLNRPVSNADVTRKDFVGCVNNFMDCQPLGVNATDLYAARCGVVHTYSPDSSLYRSGQARRIAYSWGTKGSDDPNSLLRQFQLPEQFIKVETLFAAYCDGIKKFSDAIISDPELEKLVLSRGYKMFANTPTFPTIS
jgi:hypothetical protein